MRVKTTESERPRPISLPLSAIEILKGLRYSQSKRAEMFGADSAATWISFSAVRTAIT